MAFKTDHNPILKSKLQFSGTPSVCGDISKIRSKKHKQTIVVLNKPAELPLDLEVKQKEKAATVSSYNPKETVSVHYYTNSWSENWFSLQ